MIRQDSPDLNVGFSALVLNTYNVHYSNSAVAMIFVFEGVREKPPNLSQITFF